MLGSLCVSLFVWLRVCLHLLFLLAASLIIISQTSLDIRAALGGKLTLRQCFVEVAPLPFSSTRAGRAPLTARLTQFQAKMRNQFNSQSHKCKGVAESQFKAQGSLENLPALKGNLETPMFFRSVEKESQSKVWCVRKRRGWQRRPPSRQRKVYKCVARRLHIQQ